MAYPSAPAFPSEYQQFEAEYTEEPPPDYGSALAPSRPPPFNPNAPRTNSLRNARKAFLPCNITRKKLSRSFSARHRRVLS